MRAGYSAVLVESSAYPLRGKMNSLLLISSLCLVLSAGAEENLYFDRIPYLQSPTANSVIIVSQTNMERVAELRFWNENTNETIIKGGFPAHDHVFFLNNLQENTTYLYQIYYDNDDGFNSSFTTLPEKDEIFLTIIGDSGMIGSENQIKIASQIASNKPDLMLHLGDIVTPMGHPTTYQLLYFDVYQEILASTGVYPALGNHDSFGGYCAPWLDMFYLPANNIAGDETFYSFDAGNAHFVALNTCSGNFNSQRQWLREDLNQTDKTWKIVFLHVPPYGNADHGGDPDVENSFVPIFEAFHVDLVFSGHNHVYERFYPLKRRQIIDGWQNPDFLEPGGTIYITSGGGGATTYNWSGGRDEKFSAKFLPIHHFLNLRIAADEIIMEAIDAEGSIFDRVSIRKNQPREPFYFIRGDANSDNLIDLSDAVTICGYLFLSRPACVAACDVNGSGGITIADPVNLLSFLFQGTACPVYPFPDCGRVEDVDSTGCISQCR